MYKRDYSIDIIKGIAIFFVLWGHSIQCIAGDEGFFSNWMIKFIYSFHMPLFMMISGYLFFKSCHRSFLTILKGRLISLGIPFIVWNFLLYIRKCVFDFLTTHIIHFNFSEMLNALVSGLWFLSSIFIITMLSSIIVKLFKKYKYVISAVTWICLILLNRLVGDHTADLFPFFIFGFAIAENKKLFASINKYSFGAYSVFAVLLIGVKEQYFVYVSGINPFTSDYGFIQQVWFDLYRLLIGVAGSLSIILFVKRTYQCWAKSIAHYLSTLGNNTLQIYVMQSFFLEGVLSQAVERLLITGGGTGRIICT